ncbi:MAG: ABC transporter permease [Burkholderiaceae bacterium]|nr:ABC transporter permease [Burkholderiaceae bacterium]
MTQAPGTGGHTPIGRGARPVVAGHARLPVSTMLMLAWRNLWRHRRRTLVTLASIAFGFAFAVLMIGLGDGAHNSMIRNAIKLGEGHITIQPRGYLESPANHRYLADGVGLAAKLASLGVAGSVEPRISLQVLASTPANSVGAAFEGLGGASDERVRMLEPRLLEGAWFGSGDARGIVIGDGMARKLKVGVGAKVVLMAGKQGGDSQAQLGRVRGIFDSGVDELDDYLVLADIGLARLFLEGEGADPARMPVTRFAVYLDDPDTLDMWKSRLEASVAGETVVALDWREMMPQLVQFLFIDDAGNYVFLVLILVLVVFGIVNTVLMSVLERTREFGLLRALGLGRRHLLLLVFFESLLLGVLAVAIGWLFGGGAHLWFAHFGWNMGALLGEGGTAMMGTFMDPVVISELSRARVAQLTVIIFAATLGSGIYPAIKAARVTPVQALRT